MYFPPKLDSTNNQGQGMVMRKTRFSFIILHGETVYQVLAMSAPAGVSVVDHHGLICSL
jgi:hypothetical protein